MFFKNKNSIIIVTPITYSQITFFNLHKGPHIKALSPSYSLLIYGQSNNKLFYDLRYTLFNLKKGIFLFSNILIQRGKFLFIDNFKDSEEFTQSIYDSYNIFLTNLLLVDQHFINTRWIKGFLTNFKWIFRDLQSFIFGLNKELIFPTDFNLFKIEFCKGIKLLRRIPNICFVNNMDRFLWQTFETASLRVPSIIVTGCSLEFLGFFFPLLGNLDSLDSVLFMVDLFISLIINSYIEEVFLFYFNLFLIYKHKKNKNLRIKKFKRRLKKIYKIYKIKFKRKLRERNKRNRKFYLYNKHKKNIKYNYKRNYN